jgi:hypothetical protein
VKETGPAVDIITFHPYNEFPEALKYRIMVPVAGAEGSYAPASMTFKEFRKQLGDDSTRIALWNGEAGYPSSEHTDSWKGRGPWGENIQAKWLLRRFLVDYSLNVPVMIYFYFPETSPVKSQKINAKGLYDLENDRLKQGYIALQNITSIFDIQLNTPQKVNHEFEIIDEGGFLGVRKENNKHYLQENPPYENAKSPIPIELVALTGDEDNALAYWLPWPMQEYVLAAKVNLFVKALTIENPVLVDLLSGVVYHTKTEIRENGMIFKELPLSDYPMAIVPKDLVKLKEAGR